MDRSSSMRLSAPKLGKAIADRLSGRVPAPVRVFVEDLAPGLLLENEHVVVCVAEGDEHWGGQGLSNGDLEVDDESSVPAYAAHRAVNILSGVQDTISRILREPWPRKSTGEMALPDARVDQQRLYLWFGPAEDAAALTLRPIEFSDILL
jgi:hypothetical protein